MVMHIKTRCLSQHFSELYSLATWHTLPDFCSVEEVEVVAAVLEPGQGSRAVMVPLW